MKKLFALLVLALISIPTVAMAAFFMADENVAAGDVVEGNLYLAGSSPVMSGDVRGDLYMTGGNVTVTGNVANDLVVGGGNVTITGLVEDDLRVFGGQVFINGTVNGEVISFGGDVTVGPNAVIGKDLVAGGGRVVVDESAKIAGERRIFVDESVPGEDPAQEVMNRAAAEYWTGVLIIILGYVLVAAVIMGLFPHVTSRYITTATHKGAFWKSLGLGLLLLIVTPIIALICFGTGVGTMLGFIILAMYLVYILVNLALAGVLFGAVCQKYAMKLLAAEFNWLWGLGGVVVLALLSMLPIVGFWIGAVFFLYSFGAVLTTDWKTFKAVK